ncbi:hypothetical protein RI129_004632 [Pyrocoelia pectoralis]|uniref:CRAL-TRIO domain-containing protein n=1 Tax=Pyrocoelia pectoralis TaxID=417401 RepID=A0AAN7VHH7_9COLE
MVRTLCDELQDIAIKELNENPKSTPDDLDHIRKWALNQPHLKVKLDDQRILTLLRCCKFSLQKAKLRIEQLCTMKTIAPEFFGNRDPFLPEIQDLLSLGCVLPLRKESNPAAPRIILIRMLEKTASYDVNVGIKLILMTFEILMNEDDNFIICGSKVLEDYKELSVNHIQMVSPTIIKKAITCLLTTYPLRANSFHIINASDLFTKVINLVKPFLSEKIINKIHIYKSDDLDRLVQAIPLSILPIEYGGRGGYLTDIIAEWKLKVESYRDWFSEDYEYRSDESKRLGKPMEFNEVFGLEGSFRRLQID